MAAIDKSPREEVVMHVTCQCTGLAPLTNVDCHEEPGLQPKPETRGHRKSTQSTCGLRSILNLPITTPFDTSRLASLRSDRKLRTLGGSLLDKGEAIK